MNEQLDCARRYMTAYAAGDQQAVADCLTDDVVWEVYGHGRFEGKAAYLAEMAQSGAGGSWPDVVADRYVSDGDTVVVLGRVRVPGGEAVNLVFATVFTCRGDRARLVESYVVHT